MATRPIILFPSRSAIGSNYGFFRIFEFLLITKLYETSMVTIQLANTLFVCSLLCATLSTLNRMAQGARHKVQGKERVRSKESEARIQFVNFEIRNPQFEILPHAPCSMPHAKDAWLTTTLPGGDW